MRLLVVDDHKLFADGLGYVLNTISENVELNIVNSSQSALKEIDSNSDYDLILLDLNMPGIDGISLLNAIKERNIIIPCVIISASEDINRIKQAIDLGAFGFVPKSYSSTQLKDAINVVLNGDTYLKDDLIKKIKRISRIDDQCANKISLLLNKYGITKRQYEVLKLLAKGYSNKQIACTLFLSNHTVKSHVAALLGALQAGNRTDCVRQGRDCGLIN